MSNVTKVGGGIVDATREMPDPTGNALEYVRVNAGATGYETVASAGGPATELDANGTTLTVDAIVDGEFLKRVGTTVVSAAAGGSGLSEAEVLGRMCAAGVL